MRNLLVYMCFAIFALGGAAVAAPDRAAFDLSRALNLLDQALHQDAWAVVDLPHVTAPQFETTAKAPDVRSFEMPTFQPLDLRLPLAMITQSHGAGDNDVVLEAQGDAGPQALVLRTGVARFSDVIQAAEAAGAGRRTADGGLVLTRPLVVWDTADLLLSDNDVIELDRASGAFLLILGNLKARGATIRGTLAENPHNAEFRPFVVAGSGGRLTLQGNTFADLGFGHTEKFAGVTIVRNGLMMGRGGSVIDGNLFHGVGSVWIDTAQDVSVSQNRFRAARKVPLVFTNAGRARAVGNVFFDNGEFNAIQVLRGSFSATITDNVILGGTRAGIVVKYDSHRAEIARNIVWKRQGTGIILAKSDCGQVAGNWVLENRQKGIEVRSSVGTEVTANRVALNRNTGLWISAQPRTTTTLVSGNVFSQNRTGLTTATAANLVVADNDFSGQLPRFLSGDIAPQNAAFARGMNNDTKMVLTAHGFATQNLPATGCSDGVAR